MQNLLVVSYTVCAHVIRGSKDFEEARTPPYQDGACLTIETRYCYYLCYHTKFRRSTSNPKDLNPLV